MTTTPLKTYWMEAGGKYSEHNPHSCSIADQVAECVCEAAASACTASEADLDNTFTFCDFGTADGAAGSVVAKAVIDRVKSIDEAKQVHIVFEDQAENDFSPILTKHQHNLRDGLEDVFVSVVGRSFYKQCLPAESVDLSYSCMAVMIPDPNTCADHEPPKPFNQIGVGYKWRDDSKNNNDWERFLVNRAHELKRNGRLVVVPFLFPSDVKGSSPTDEAYRAWDQQYSFFAEIYGELQKEGRLNADEYLSDYAKYRSVEELEAPFRQEFSAVRKSGLRLCSIKTAVTPCRIGKQFRDGKISKEEYGRSVANCFRSWSYFLVANSLKTDRSKEEKGLLIEEIYLRLAKRIATKGPYVGLPHPIAILVARKESG